MLSVSIWVFLLHWSDNLPIYFLHFLVEKKSHFQECRGFPWFLLRTWETKNKLLIFYWFFQGECWNCLVTGCIDTLLCLGWEFPSCLNAALRSGNDTAVSIVRHRAFALSLTHLDISLHWMFSYLCKIEHDWRERFVQPRTTCFTDRTSGGPVYAVSRAAVWRQLQAGCRTFPSPTDPDEHGRLSTWAQTRLSI